MCKIVREGDTVGESFTAQGEQIFRQSTNVSASLATFSTVFLTKFWTLVKMDREVEDIRHCAIRHDHTQAILENVNHKKFHC